MWKTRRFNAMCSIHATCSSAPEREQSELLSCESAADGGLFANQHSRRIKLKVRTVETTAVSASIAVQISAHTVLEFAS